MICPSGYDRKYIKTVAECSYDDTNKLTLVNKPDEIICFDLVKEDHIKALGSVCAFPCSLDGLFCDEHSDFIFVEFKSGTIDKKQFIQKVYDSSLILMEKYSKSTDWLRRNVRLILVHGDDNENERARHTLFQHGKRHSSSNLRCYLPNHIVGFFLKDYTYMTPDQFASLYCL